MKFLAPSERSRTALWRALAAIPAALLAFAPELARACAVCGAGADEDQSRVAYLLTTVALSALPLGLFGGLVLWLRLRAKSGETRPAP
jgi:hypothetical protein